MFLGFIKKFSRPKFGFIIALLMLFAPIFIVTTVESAQKTKAKPTPTPKKKAAPTPAKTQAKTKPAPKSTPANKSKSTIKNSTQNASKNKTADKRNEKTTAKTDKKTTDKNAKTANSKNSKTTPKTDGKNSSKSTKSTDKNAASKNAKTNAADKSKTKIAAVKTSEPRNRKSTKPDEPKPITEKKSKTADISKTPDKNIIKTIETVSKDSPQIIVTTFSVPIKSQAKADAATVYNAKLGTVLKVTEKNPAWYKVQYSTGGKSATGWVSANSVNDLNSAGKTEIYSQIAERNYKPQMNFETASEFYDFTSKVDGDLDASDKSAEIQLKRLLALRSALKTIPADKRETAPYKDFLKLREKEIVYNEPAGQWLVAANEFWDLHNKYRKSVISDKIAWEAANNPLPGECQGYVNCYLFDMRMRFGEYLNLHPNGKNSAEALKNMTDYLAPIVADANQKTIYNGPTDVTDRAEFNNLLAELRTIVARLPFVEKEKTLQQFKTIAEAFR